MRTNIIFIAVILFSMAINSCKEENEFNIDLIPGDYIGDLYYWNSWGGTWTTIGSTDPSKGKELILSIKKTGSNYVILFDKSFIHKIPEIQEIPDLTVEITPTKSPDVYAVTTLPGQAYNSLIKEYNYNNLPSNGFVISTPNQLVNCYLTLRSNETDSIHSLQMTIHKTY